jgi:hypothetical protein
MIMFRFAQIFVLIVATMWAVELCRCYLAKRKREDPPEGTALGD